VDPQLSHRAARALFLERADDALPPDSERRLDAHLRACADCAAGWQAYASAVGAVRATRPERAPPALATVVMRRVRRGRQRPAARLAAQLQLDALLPLEAAVPLLLGIAAAAFLVLAAP
jgi:anti-sigma factor RsiW